MRTTRPVLCIVVAALLLVPERQASLHGQNPPAGSGQPAFQVDDRPRRSRRRRPRRGRQLRPRPQGREHHAPGERQAAENPAVLHGHQQPGALGRAGQRARRRGAIRRASRVRDAVRRGPSRQRLADARQEGGRGVHPRHDSRRRRRRRVPQRRHVQGTADRRTRRSSSPASARCSRRSRTARRSSRRSASGPASPARSTPARIADGAREVTDALGVKACQEDPAECAAKAASATSRT